MTRIFQMIFQIIFYYKNRNKLQKENQNTPLCHNRPKQSVIMSEIIKKSIGDFRLNFVFSVVVIESQVISPCFNHV